MKATRDRNRVTPEGRALGEQMVRMTETSIAKLAAEGEPDERCKSCAFRAGTVPNGCLQTQMDAMKAVVEDVPFLCHQADREGWPCHGWFAARVAINHAERDRGVTLKVTCPWEFSPPDDADDAGPQAHSASGSPGSESTRPDQTNSAEFDGIRSGVSSIGLGAEGEQ